ncbi:MAG TPA: SDR family NAD(P)-dependent oxidoreductase [Steroidobacteraceae bacterium]|jgi:NAD(P)-dependent dehydrogenase (short-subunit alcohol dehydrogenase family)|nr:SDR family NAD(P)-dependent oxidoreductase [Steroidobacteraceae bacterium]
MPITFDGQVVIVTGAGQGLGREYALELGRRAAAVVVNDVAGLNTKEGSAADAVVSEIQSAGGKAVASYDTVATADGGQAIVDRALEIFGTVDAVIHNAGVWRHKLYHEMTADQLDPVLDVHLRGAFFVTQPAWSIMKEKGYGRIVLTSSSSGAFGREAGTNYAAAKAGLLGLSRALALEGAHYGIRSNCILPIAPFRKRGPVPAALTERLTNAGLPRDSGPELVAPMVAYLASAACAVNGEAFSAGGGRYGRVFIGVADGWLSPAGACATAEDIEAHLDEIEDIGTYRVPASSWDELRDIGLLHSRRSKTPDGFNDA